MSRCSGGRADVGEAVLRAAGSSGLEVSRFSMGEDNGFLFIMACLSLLVGAKRQVRGGPGCGQSGGAARVVTAYADDVFTNGSNGSGRRQSGDEATQQRNGHGRGGDTEASKLRAEAVPARMSSQGEYNWDGGLQPGSPATTARKQATFGVKCSTHCGNTQTPTGGWLQLGRIVDRDDLQLAPGSVWSGCGTHLERI